MTTILVTGGAGYIGSHTDVELLNKGYDVVCVDNYCNSSPESLNRVETITGRTVTRYDGDVRDYIHVVDLAKGHVAVIDRITDPGVYTYNLGTGHGYSVLEVIKAYEKAAGHEIPYVIKDRRPGDIDACYADAAKAERELGWKAELDIDAMAVSSMNWQTKNPNGYREA